MAQLLLNFRNVPDDEIDEVRALLNSHGVAFYETRPSLWGISAGGIWLARDEELVTAKRLLAEYQEERRVRMREAFEQARAEGRVESFGTRLRRRPLEVLFALAVVAGLLALILIPFWGI